MQYGYLAAYFFGGAFLANAVPLYVSGAMGHPFQSLFAKPPGKWLSSAFVMFSGASSTWTWPCVTSMAACVPELA